MAKPQLTRWSRPITDVTSNDVICNGGCVWMYIGEVALASSDMHLAPTLSIPLFPRI